MCSLFFPLLAYDRASFRYWQLKTCVLYNTHTQFEEEWQHLQLCLQWQEACPSMNNTNVYLLWSRKMLVWVRGTVSSLIQQLQVYILMQRYFHQHTTVSASCLINTGEEKLPVKFGRVFQNYFRIAFQQFKEINIQTYQ